MSLQVTIFYRAKLGFIMLIIVGGMLIGVEMASIYNELGCDVRLLSAMDMILSGMDKEISQSISMGLKEKESPSILAKGY